MNINVLCQTTVGKYSYLLLVTLFGYLLPIALYFNHPQTTTNVLYLLLVFPLLLPLLYANATEIKETPPIKQAGTIAKVFLLQLVLFALSNHIGTISYHYMHSPFVWNTFQTAAWAALWCLYLTCAMLIKQTDQSHFLTLIPNSKSSYNSLFIKRNLGLAYKGNALFATCCYFAFLVVALATQLLNHLNARLPRDSINAYLFYSLLIIVLVHPKMNTLYQYCQRLKLNLAVHVTTLSLLLIFLIVLLSATTEITGTITSSLNFFSFWQPKARPALSFGILISLTPYVGTLLATLCRQISVRAMATTSLILPLLLLAYSATVGALTCPPAINWIGSIGMLMFIAHSGSGFITQPKQITKTRRPLFVIPTFQKALYQPLTTAITLVTVVTLLGSFNFVLLATFTCGTVTAAIFFVLGVLSISQGLKQRLSIDTKTVLSHQRPSQKTTHETYNPTFDE